MIEGYGVVKWMVGQTVNNYSLLFTNLEKIVPTILPLLVSKLTSVR